MNEFSEKDRDSLIEEIGRLEKELAEAKKRADTCPGYFQEESDRFRRYRDAVRSAVNDLDVAMTARTPATYRD